jgi:hypothetical protein
MLPAIKKITNKRQSFGKVTPLRKPILGRMKSMHLHKEEKRIEMTTMTRIMPPRTIPCSDGVFKK